MRSIVPSSLNDSEQLVELIVASQAGDSLRLPVIESAINELVVLLSGQCLHEQEVPRWNSVFDTRWSYYDGKVRVCLLEI